MPLSATHIRLEQLLELIEGHVTPYQAVNTQEHLAACKQCASDLAWLERLVQLMRSDQSEDAPPAAIQRVLQIFQHRETGVQPSLRQRIIAMLRLDTAQLTPAYGLRSGQSATRQLLFGAGDYDLDIRLTSTSGAWQVSGQILGADTKGYAQLRGETRRAEAQLNDLGEFILAPVPAGIYELTLQLPEVDIDVRNLEVGSH